MATQNLQEMKKEVTPVTSSHSSSTFSTTSSFTSSPVLAMALTTPITSRPVLITTTAGNVSHSLASQLATLRKPPPLVSAAPTSQTVNPSLTRAVNVPSSQGTSNVIISAKPSEISEKPLQAILISESSSDKIKLQKLPVTSDSSSVIGVTEAAKPPTTGPLNANASSSASGVLNVSASGMLNVIKTLSSSPSSNSGGGLGAGKPKAFLALMTSSAPKKQTKRATNNRAGASGSKGQGTTKTKASPSSTVNSKKTEQLPSRTSNRNIKRPRTYDEELDDLKALKMSATKKAKGTPKGNIGVPKGIGKKSSAISASSGLKDLGRWRPTDDLMLISAVQQTNDLVAVHLGVNFSCRFTLQEVEERWYALLYSQRVSQLAIEAMRGLHPGVVTMALNNALWSQEEEAVLARIPNTDPGHLEKFQAVLRDNPAVFHTCRTATSLHHHWVLMGHNGLLNNQKVDLIPPEENIKEFKDAEDRLEDSELMRPRDVKEEALEQELMISDRQAKAEILRLEEELPSWRTVIETGSGPEFGPSDFAVFKGRVVEFRMVKRMVCLGRATSTNVVDFDLSLEGPAFKISRRQATIQLTDNGEFMLHNEGRRPMYIGGKAVMARTSAKLVHNQVLEVASMSFLILLNTKLANSVKNSS